MCAHADEGCCQGHLLELIEPQAVGSFARLRRAREALNQNALGQRSVPDLRRSFR